ncbi:amino acid ABC transporter substrate-binding protein [Xenophilus sp. Marseille-Q4582]|uniref:amino acid ABC transporter substrate-binding protein n=1 Tax=Xenophilus sp. Marseille-Q4582 TaxID=2866600 RepID=UPI001CE3D6AC|nr:amino acid ABC transporter substrate-binding protein [Xenophilus sp. Marseille-Q4582]
MSLSRRRVLSRFALGLAIPSLPALAQQQVVRIGWALSKTGPNAGGAAVSSAPNYDLWIRQLQAAGGLKLGERRVPVEVVQYDDRSSPEEAVRAVERLISQDKVDLVLAPWGTALNMAVAPVLHRAGYPHLAATAMTTRTADFVKRWPGSFWPLGPIEIGAQNIAKMLVQLRDQGRIGNTVALVGIADAWGVAGTSVARQELPKAGFKLVYDKTYPIGTQDVAPIVSEIKAQAPDVLLAFSYPPDTFALTEQARLTGLSPKVFITGVGTAFPQFKKRFGAAAEGVIGTGGWNPDIPAARDYLKQHREMTGAEPDRMGSLTTWASLQMLQQAIERVGRLDRPAIIRELQTGTFDTIFGPWKFENNLPARPWTLGQWRGDEFVGVAPAHHPGAAALTVPKAPWPAAN